MTMIHRTIKIMVSMVLLAGLFPCVAHAVRKHVLNPVSFENILPDDFFWYYQQLALSQNTLPHIWNRLYPDNNIPNRMNSADVYSGCLLLECMAYVHHALPDSLGRQRIDLLARCLEGARIPKEHKDRAQFYRAALAYKRIAGKQPLWNRTLKEAREFAQGILARPNSRYDCMHPNMPIALGDFYNITSDSVFLKAALCLLQKMKPYGWKEEQACYYAAQVWIKALAGDNCGVQQNLQLWQQCVDHTKRVTGGFCADKQGKQQNGFSLLETTAAMEWCSRLFLATRNVQCMEIYEQMMYNELRTAFSPLGMSVPENLYVPFEKTLTRDSVNAVPEQLLLQMARNIAVLPDMYYATEADTAVYVNQYFRGETQIKTKILDFKLSTMSSMPWYGGFYMDVVADSPQKCTFLLRVPNWAMPVDTSSVGPFRLLSKNNRLVLAVNGQRKPLVVENGFLKLSGVWHNGDRITFNFLSPVRKIVAKNESKITKIAFQRGPFVFCMQPDNEAMAKKSECVNVNESMPVRFQASDTGGVQLLECNVYPSNNKAQTPQKAVLIPFFSRKQGAKLHTILWFQVKQHGK